MACLTNDISVTLEGIITKKHRVEKQSNTHTQAHANPSDAAKGQTAPAGLLRIGRTILCLCHQTEKGPPGKAAALPWLLLCSQPPLSPQVPQHQEQAEGRFSPLLSSFPPSPKMNIQSPGCWPNPVCLRHRCTWIHICPAQW